MTAPAEPSPGLHPWAEFHLLVDHGFATAAGTPPKPPAENPWGEPLIVPQGITRFVWPQNGTVELVVATVREAQTDPLLESLAGTPQPRLLLLSPPGRRPRVNGMLAARVAILSEADRFQFDDRCQFLVAVFHRPRLGPVPDELVRTPCAICGIALTKGDRCLVCPCGAPLHAAEEETREGALTCLNMASCCTRCGLALQPDPGYGPLSLHLQD